MYLENYVSFSLDLRFTDVVLHCIDSSLYCPDIDQKHQ